MVSSNSTSYLLWVLSFDVCFANIGVDEEFDGWLNFPFELRIAISLRDFLPKKSSSSSTAKQKERERNNLK